MSDIAIRVENLAKLYHIGGAKKTYNRFGEQLVDTVTAPFRRASNLLRGQTSGAAELDETIWALKDISFEIQRGDVVGVIGRNGAGKSTLLKILSRITDPTSGFVDIYGRVGSLLEVGTGFHPELTGRENIYLNGAILGMKKGEIDQKFDEIVAFAEIDKFIDTPVKHYSSGMYVRLAFSVAAHLEPEILLIDEVLAVGDLAFQRKCLGKMGDVARQGRTVLFISHNMTLVQSLCDRGFLLQEGIMVADGPITEVVNAYLKSIESAESQDLRERMDRKGQGKVKLTAIEINGESNGSISALKTGEPVQFVFHINGLIPGLFMNFSLYDQFGQPIASFRSKDRGPKDSHDPRISSKFICDLDQLLLLPGRYRVDVGIIGDNRLQDYIEAAAIFDVVEGLVEGRPINRRNRNVNVYLPHRWTLPIKD